jgi:hypothetical protein
MVTEFPAIVAKVTTLADGGKRVTFDLPEDTSVQAGQLMELQRMGMALTVRVYPAQEIRSEDD